MRAHRGKQLVRRSAKRRGNILAAVMREANRHGRSLSEHGRL
jgi:hypothetical protein